MENGQERPGEIAVVRDRLLHDEGVGWAEHSGFSDEKASTAIAPAVGSCGLARPFMTHRDVMRHEVVLALPRRVTLV
jgi:hypothetical protein